MSLIIGIILLDIPGVEIIDCPGQVKIGFGHVKNNNGFPTEMCQKGIGANGNISLQLLVPEKWFTYQNLQNFTKISEKICVDGYL